MKKQVKQEVKQEVEPVVEVKKRGRKPGTVIEPLNVRLYKKIEAAYGFTPKFNEIRLDLKEMLSTMQEQKQQTKGIDRILKNKSKQELQAFAELLQAKLNE